MTTNWRIGQSLSVLSLLMAGVLPAVADDMRVDWQGFIAQGLIQAPDSSFVNFDGDMSAELTELGLSSSVQLAPAWRVAAQIVYLNGGNRYPPGLRLDYLFIDWNFFSSLDWQANVYLGRFKNQHWLFSATRDVPFTRPSIVLPQSIYFDAFRDISVATDGIAFQARNAGQYGDITINWSYGSTAISDEQSQLLLGRSTQGDMNLDFSHQASVFWQPVMSRFSFGLSLLDSDFNYTSAQNEPLSPADFTVQRVMLSARYQAELWDLTLEMQQERVKIEGFFAPQFYQNQFGQGGYLLLQYRPAANWRLYSWLDYSVNNKDDRQGTQLTQNTAGQIPAYFGYQHTLATGINYDFSPQLSVNAEVHWVKGTGRLSPVIMPDVINNTQQYWQMYALQLMYRF